MPTQIDRKLAAKAIQRQADALIELEKIDRVIGKQLAPRQLDLIQLITSEKGIGKKLLEFSEIMQLAIRTAADTTRKELTNFVAWSHRSAVWAILDTVPRQWLATKVPREMRLAIEVHRPVKSGWLVAGYEGLRLIVEEEPSSNVFFGTPVKPLVYKKLSDKQKDEVLQKILFPAPSAREVAEIIAKTGWQDRFASLSSLITDNRALFGQLVTGYAEGENLQQLKRRALPLVDGIQASAKRIVRTEGMRVAEQIQRRSWEPLGDMMIGAQIIAVLDERTRPEHATRNGTIYYKNPKAGQKSMSELPDLPDEPNCRCMSVPVMEPPEELKNDPEVRKAFAELPGVGVPDPETHEQWFAQADPARRKLVVGVSRYHEIEKQLADTRQPEWSDFIAEDGSLLTLAELKSETSTERLARKMEVQRLMRERGAALRAIASRGFEFPGE